MNLLPAAHVRLMTNRFHGFWDKEGMDETMGLFYFFTIGGAAAFLLLRGMENLITISKKPWKRFILWFSCCFSLGTIIYMGDWGNILPAICFFLLTILITCEGSFWKKITIGLMYASTILAFNVLRDNYFISLDMRASRRYLSLFLSSSFSLILALFLYLTNRKLALARDYYLSDSLWKLLLLLNATPLGIVLCLVLLTTLGRRSLLRDAIGFEYDYIVLLILAMLSFIGLFQIVTVLAKQQKLKEQNMLAEINRNYYESMEQQHFAVRRLKHDLANHLSVLSVMPGEQREEYIKGLMEGSIFNKPLKYCEDTVVNAVLSVKKEQMDHYGIRLETEIQILKELPFEKSDICALFANALDNAMDACRKLSPEKRTILLKSKAQKGLFCLEVKNPLEAASQKISSERIQNGNAPDRATKSRLPQTSKPDKENHGIGLRSMQEITERYHGKMILRTKGELFEVFLYLPLAEV